jgi:hypothetical protein
MNTVVDYLTELLGMPRENCMYLVSLQVAWLSGIILNTYVPKSANARYWYSLLVGIYF